MAGTGAFLLLAAAAVFIAVRWDSIPDAAKLAAIVAITGVCLHVGHRYREELPATASTLFHLGALLLPIDVAAIGRNAQFDWSGLLLAEGVLCLPAFLLLSRANDSVVLRWASVAAGLALSGGIGATTGVPAPLALAAMAVAAELVARDRLALPWAAVAGLCPAVAVAESAIVNGRGTLDRLGLTGAHPRLTAAITAALAAFVLGRAAMRRSDLGLALATIATLIVGAATTFTGIEGTGRYSVAGAAGLVLVLELVAAAARDDRFWARPAALVAQVAEAAAVIVTLLAAGDAPATPMLLLAAAWVVAGERRGGWAPATAAASGSLVAAVAIATTSPTAVAAAMLAMAGLLTVVRRPGGTPTMTALAAFAPLAAAPDRAAGAVAGTVGAFLIAYAATRSRSEEAAALAVASISPLGAGVAIALTEWAAGPVLAGATVAAWALALLLDTGRPIQGTLRTGDLSRCAAVLILGGAAALPANEAVLVSGVFAVLALIDAVRLDDSRIAFGASAAVALGCFHTGPALGVEPSVHGVALTTLAAVAVSGAFLVPRRWRWPMLAAGAGLGAPGLFLAASDPSDFGTALLIAGGVAVAGGLARRRRDLLVAGGWVMTLGTWFHLGAAEVRASEPYLAPVALILLFAGLADRRRGANSWQAYGLPVAMVGGSALAERVAGGGPGHALVAGAVGVAAVIAGGDRSLQAPLLLGTTLLVVATIHETLALTAGVPTWVWLALAGSALLAAGMWMDRHEIGPIETGRRLVDVVQDRFA